MHLKRRDLALLCSLLCPVVMIMAIHEESEPKAPWEPAPACGYWEVRTEDGVQSLHNSETGETICKAVAATEDGMAELDLEEYAQRLNAEAAEAQRPPLSG